jgi:ribose transport system substrate-binding protein
MRVIGALTNVVLTAGSAAVFAIGVAASSRAADKPFSIAISNAYYGNNWRHQMVESFNKAADQAKKDKLVSDYVVLNGDNTVNAQIAQMSDLIIKKPDAILMNAASLTALNGVVQKACAAGIVVVAFDSIVSAPCAYKVDWDFANWQGPLTDGVAKLMGGKGNMIVVRGVRGSAPDKFIYEQEMKTLEKYPDIKVVSTVYGMASSSVAQQAISNVLPSLPTVQGIIGDAQAYGAVQALEQFGGPYATKMPIIGGDGDANFIHWWIEQKKKNGYQTLSLNTAPSISQVALWVAIAILEGKKVPKDMKMPVQTVTNDTVENFADLKPGTVVAPDYSAEWVDKNLLNQEN